MGQCNYRAPLAEPSLRGKLAACKGRQMMTRRIHILAFCLICGAMAVAGSAQTAQKGGMLKTMPQGVYQCALPGDAAGAAWQVVKDLEFTIMNASSYTSANGRGTYLLKGDRLVFTRGPLKGTRLQQVGEFTLRVLGPDGEKSAVRCVRVGSAK